MKTHFLINIGLLICFNSYAQTPPTRKQPVTDTYFGKTIVDNYRWLEDINSQEVKDWFKAQGDYTNSDSIRFQAAIV